MKWALERLWDVIETNGCKAPLYEWQSFLDREFNSFSSYLSPTGQYAESYPCPAPGLDGCPRSIIKKSSSKCLAICGCTEFPKNCTEVEIDSYALAVYEIRWHKFCNMLADLLDVKSDFQRLNDYIHTFKIGDYLTHASMHFPVYLTFHHKSEHLKHAITKLCNSRDSKPFIFITSSLRKLDNDTISLMEKVGATFLCLSDMLYYNVEGSLGLNSKPDELLKDFRQKVKNEVEKEEKRAGIVKFRHVVPGTRWNEVTVQFTDGHTVLLTCRGKSMTATYSDLGMAKSRAGKPTVLWNMLYDFALNYGVIDWSSSAASTSVVKRKDRLCKIFNHIFNIEGNAIIWDKKAKQYRCLFKIEPD